MKKGGGDQHALGVHCSTWAARATAQQGTQPIAAHLHDAAGLVPALDQLALLLLLLIFRFKLGQHVLAACKRRSMLAGSARGGNANDLT